MVRFACLGGGGCVHGWRECCEFGGLVRSWRIPCSSSNRRRQQKGGNKTGSLIAPGCDQYHKTTGNRSGSVNRPSNGPPAHRSSKAPQQNKSCSRAVQPGPPPRTIKGHQCAGKFVPSALVCAASPRACNRRRFSDGGRELGDAHRKVPLRSIDRHLCVVIRHVSAVFKQGGRINEGRSERSPIVRASVHVNSNAPMNVNASCRTHPSSHHAPPSRKPKPTRATATTTTTFCLVCSSNNNAHYITQAGHSAG